jgi:hypothetical protein
VTHAAESLHWYDREGRPAYQVKSKDGSLRNTTLRDARKLNLVPSVTTIIRCAAAPGLERWKQDQVLHAALTLPRGPTEPEAEWISRVWSDSKETARKAAERGTAIHAAIQGHFEGEAPSADLYDHVKGFVKTLREWYGVLSLNWEAERSFSHRLGFGGKVDLHAPQFLCDVKTKEFDEKTDLKTWDEHAMQLAAYRVGLGMPQASAAIVYVSVTQPGLSRLIEIPEEELKKGWRMFHALLAYWQAKSGYVSSWDPDLEKSLAAA